MNEGLVERRLAAADVAGYSRLMGRDEARTLARLKRLRRELIDPRLPSTRDASLERKEIRNAGSSPPIHTRDSNR
jgi:hypothetical protein